MIVAKINVVVVVHEDKDIYIGVCVCWVVRGEDKVMLVECLDSRVVWLQCWC